MSKYNFKNMTFSNRLSKTEREEIENYIEKYDQEQEKYVNEVFPFAEKISIGILIAILILLFAGSIFLGIKIGEFNSLLLVTTAGVFVLLFIILGLADVIPFFFVLAIVEMWKMPPRETSDLDYEKCKEKLEIEEIILGTLELDTSAFECLDKTFLYEPSGGDEQLVVTCTYANLKNGDIFYKTEALPVSSMKRNRVIEVPIYDASTLELVIPVDWNGEDKDNPQD